jgi:hypothetical protein
MNNSTQVSTISSEFWPKWQRINGRNVTPAYGRAWTEVQMRIYVETPQVPCRQWFAREHRAHLVQPK